MSGFVIGKHGGHRWVLSKVYIDDCFQVDISHNINVRRILLTLTVFQECRAQVQVDVVRAYSKLY